MKMLLLIGYAFDLQKIKIIPQVEVGVSDFHFRGAAITGSELSRYWCNLEV